MSLLILVPEESTKHFNSIKFIYEQLNLISLVILQKWWYFLRCYITAPLDGTDH